MFEIAVTAAGAVCGEALVALLGVMLSDPQVRWPAITNVFTGRPAPLRRATEASSFTQTIRQSPNERAWRSIASMQ